MTDAGKRLQAAMLAVGMSSDSVTKLGAVVTDIEAEAVAAERQRIKAAVEGLRDTGLNVSVVDTTGVTRRGRIQEFVWRSAVLAIIDGEAT